MNPTRLGFVLVVTLTAPAFAADPVLGSCARDKMGTCLENTKFHPNEKYDSGLCTSTKGVWRSKQACAEEERAAACTYADGRIAHYYKKFVKIGGDLETMKEQCAELKGTFSEVKP